MDLYKLLLFAAIILYINRSIPERYFHYENGDTIHTGRRHAFRLHLLHLSARLGERMTRNITLLLVTLIWGAFMGFCAAAVHFFPQPMLKVVAGLVGGLGTITYLRDLSTVWRSFVSWCYSQEDDILLITQGCWEVVLAGLVVIDSLLLI